MCVCVSIQAEADGIDALERYRGKCEPTFLFYGVSFDVCFQWMSLSSLECQTLFLVQYLEVKSSGWASAKTGTEMKKKVWIIKKLKVLWCCQHILYTFFILKNNSLNWHQLVKENTETFLWYYGAMLAVLFFNLFSVFCLPSYSLMLFIFFYWELSFIYSFLLGLHWATKLLK